MLQRDGIVPGPERSIGELTQVGLRHVHRLRIRRRVQAAVAIGLTVVVAAAAIPVLLRSTSVGIENIAPLERPGRRGEDKPADARNEDPSEPSRRIAGSSRAGPDTRQPDTRAPVTAGKKAPSAARQDRIAFIRRESGWGDLLVMDGDGVVVSSVTEDTSDQRDPDWSPDGRRIVFASNDELYVYGRYGTLTMLTESPGVLEAGPSWSPDGRRIAFAARALDERYMRGQSDLYVMDDDGNDLVRLTSTSNLDETAPAWAPDGRTIAFARNGSTTDPGIFTMEPDGSGVRRVTTGQDLEPSWSPDGSKLVFTRYDAVSATPSDIYVMAADGSGQRNLTNSVELYEYTADWSPDGKTIAFTRDDDGRDSPADDPFANGTTQWLADRSAGRRSAIFAMGADGSSPRALTPYEGMDESPAYRP